MLTKLSHTSSLCFTAIVTGLNISFDPAAPLLLCCRFIIYKHTVTGQTPSAQKATESVERVKISFGIIAWKETAKSAFSSIIDICLQAMHNAGARSYDNHVLNIMFGGSGGLVLQVC